MGLARYTKRYMPGNIMYDMCAWHELTRLKSMWNPNWGFFAKQLSGFLSGNLTVPPKSYLPELIALILAIITI